MDKMCGVRNYSGVSNHKFHRIFPFSPCDCDKEDGTYYDITLVYDEKTRDITSVTMECYECGAKKPFTFIDKKIDDIDEVKFEPSKKR